MVVAASTTTPNHKTTPSNYPRSSSIPKRPPLLPSEKDNNNVGIPAQHNHRRPKSREVNSRYLSTSSSSSTSNSSSSTTTFSNSTPSYRRCPSPLPSSTRPHSSSSPMITSSAIKRAQSAERRRPTTPMPKAGRISGEMSAAAKMLVSSSRSLSVSFQGESFAVPRARSITRSSPSPTSTQQRGTPERKRIATTPGKGGENTRPPIEQPWPGRVVSLSRSVDLGREGKKLISGSTTGKVVRALQESLISEKNRASSDATLSKSSHKGDHDVVNDTLRRSMSKDDACCVNVSSVGSGSRVSDTESLSSECNSDSNSSFGGRGKGGGRRTIVVPPRYWQETNNRLRRGSEPGSPMARTSSLKGTVPPKLITPKKFVSDSLGASPKGSASYRGSSSPIRGSVRPASPSKPRPASPSMPRPASPSMPRPASPSKLPTLDSSSPSGGMGRIASPSRVRNAMPSALCFGADVRRVKVGDNRLGDAHLLRLLHNRHLQWRFVNARAEDSQSMQKFHAERSLHNTWKTISDLRVAVSSKRKELQWLRQKLKLLCILKGQMIHLEEWVLMDKDHCSSLLAAIESLKASTIRLPLVAGARGDVQDVKDAIWSAADVMHAMASSICYLLRKVEEVNSLVAEVASLMSKEHSFLSECKDTLSMLAAMQVKDSSIRAHILQLKCAPSSLTVQV